MDKIIYGSMITLIGCNYAYAEYNPCLDLNKDSYEYKVHCDVRGFNNLLVKSFTIQGGLPYFSSTLPALVTSHLVSADPRNSTSYAKNFNVISGEDFSLRVNSLLKINNSSNKKNEDPLDLKNTALKPVFSITAFYSKADKNIKNSNSEFIEPIVSSIGSDVITQAALSNKQRLDFGFVSIERLNNTEKALFPKLFDVNTSVGLIAARINQKGKLKLDHNFIDPYASANTKNNFLGAGITAGIGAGIRLFCNNTAIDFASRLGMLFGSNNQVVSNSDNNFMPTTEYEYKKFTIVPIIDLDISFTQKIYSDLFLKLSGYSLAAITPQAPQILSNRGSADPTTFIANYYINSDNVFRHASLMLGFEYMFS